MANHSFGFVFSEDGFRMAQDQNDASRLMLSLFDQLLSQNFHRAGEHLFSAFSGSSKKTSSTNLKYRPDFCRRTGRLSYGACYSRYKCKPKVLVSDVPLSVDNSYFEIEILTEGEKCSIVIGLVPENYPVKNLPGWKTGSIGYHADDGGVYIENATSFRKRREQCYRGDTMGCGVENRNGRQFIYFTKNGQSVAEQPFGYESSLLYPAVGLNSPGEEVRLLNGDIWGLISEPDVHDADVMSEAAECNADVSSTGHISFLWPHEGSKTAVVTGHVSLSADHSFFEIEIFAIPDGCDVSVALVPSRYQNDQQIPVLYRASDGIANCGSNGMVGMERQPCSAGDKMGCGLEFKDDDCYVYFTRNSTTFVECPLGDNSDTELYPAVILCSSSTRTVSVCVQDCPSWGFVTSTNVRRQHVAANPYVGSVVHQQHIEIDSNSLTLSLQPGPNGTARNATLVSAKPFSDENVSYFELEIVSGHTIVVGAAVVDDCSNHELPGWKHGSVGYHSDNGGIYMEDSHPITKVHKCVDGDSMGCGIYKDDVGQKVYFTRNGETVSEICFGEGYKSLYPVIGLRSLDQPSVVFMSDLASSDLWKINSCRSQTAAAAGDNAESEPGDSTKVDGVPDQQVSGELMEKINKELQCPICWLMLRKPKLLPCCQHTFCFDCIDTFIRDHGNSGQMLCPICRKEFHLPPGGAVTLENNSIACRLLEIIKK